jgi:hypothetical protein
MAFWIALTSLGIAAFAMSFASGHYRWRWYLVPGALTLLYVAVMGYVIAYTSTCTDCHRYQSGPEEVRNIVTVYATAGLVLALALWAIAYALGRRYARTQASAPGGPSR